MKPGSPEPFKPPKSREDVRVESHRCPYCRDDVAAEESVVCQGCLTRHHRPCWDEGSGCSSCRGTIRLEPQRDADLASLPSRWVEADRSLTFAVTFKGRLLRANQNPSTTRLSLSAGDELLAEETRSLASVFVDALLTWFGRRPTWTVEGELEIEGKRVRIKAVHQVTFSRWYVQLYADDELLGPEPRSP